MQQLRPWMRFKMNLKRFQLSPQANSQSLQRKLISYPNFLKMIKVPNQAYPLIERGRKQIPKGFRKQMILLFSNLIKLSHSTSILYEDDDLLMNTLQAYLVPMSSSSLRSFRHTSTVITLLGLLTGLSEILVEVRKEVKSLSQKVEVETEKQRHRDDPSDQLQAWQKRKEEVEGQKVALENYIGDLFDGCVPPFLITSITFNFFFNLFKKTGIRTRSLISNIFYFLQSLCSSISRCGPQY